VVDVSHVADEVRPVTALFADVVGSTALGERLQPDEVKVLIGDCVSRMSRAVEEHGGMVQAYAGDGICAYFGVPAARDDDADRAALAALEIVREMETFAVEIASAWDVADFQVRLGLNSGQAGVGTVGAGHPQFVALGDMTNVAARLQAAAEPGSIVVGESTARRVSARFVLEPLGELAVKGRAAPVPAWRLVRRKTAQRRISRVPLVGRTTEIARLQKVVAELQSGRGIVLSVRGDAGLGKSCLLGEVGDLVSREVIWIEGQCRAYSPLYWPFLEMLRSWLGVDEIEAEIVVRTRLRARLSEAVGDEIGEVLPYLGHLLGIKQNATDATSIQELSPADLAERVRLAFRRWISCLAHTAPVVVAIEDMHVADPATCHAAEALLSVTDEAPLLLAVTMRPEPDSGGWAFHVSALASHPHRVVDLSLEPLEEAEAEELATALGVSEPATRRLIVSRAEGNPLYLEELCAASPSLEEMRSRTWTITTTRADLPSPLDTLLIGQIDGLGADARALVQAAAVIGRVFTASVLEKIAGAEAIRGMPELLRRGIIRERRRYPELEYRFRHGMLQEAALSTLTAARREALYRAGAAAVETLYGDALEEHAEILAHYHAHGGEPEATLRYLEMAAERADSLGEASHTLNLWMRAARAAAAIGDASAEARAIERIREAERRDHAAPPDDAAEAPPDDAAEAPPDDPVGAPAPLVAPLHSGGLNDYTVQETLVVDGPLSLHRATAADGSPVALHVIEKRPGSEGAAGRRLLERAQAVQALDDKHVVSVIEAVDLGDALVVASSWVAGGSLRRRLTHGPLTVAQATWMVAHVAVGLDVAHAAGVVHGVLTPAAVLFDDDRGAVTWIAGTRHVPEGYLAPEVLEGGAPTVAGDIYALASIALACLTGADPPIAPGEAPIPNAVPVGPGVAWAIRLGRAADAAGRPPTAMMFAQMLKRAATPAQLR
jgi:class 3 adenylate cyclase